MEIPESIYSYISEMEDLTTSNGDPYLEEGVLYDLPGIPVGFHKVVIHPGDILPIRLMSSSAVNAVRLALEAPPPTHHLLVVNIQSCTASDDSAFFIGTVVEIIKVSRNSRQRDLMHAYILTRAIQRIRFNVCNGFSLRLVTSMTFSNVSVFPDYCPSPPLPQLYSYGIEHNIGTPWPPYVYKKHIPRALLQSSLRMYRSKITDCKVVEQCTDPVQFSYWLQNNFPFDIRQQRELLSIDNVTNQLRKATSMMEMATGLYCRRCKDRIAALDQIFCYGEGGRVRYVNDYGSVHDLVMVRNVYAIIDDVMYRENTWFEGYGWKLCHCNGCQQHLGWAYTLVAHDTPRSPDHEDLPFQFFGFRRDVIVNNNEEEREQTGELEFLHRFFDIPERFSSPDSTPESFDGTSDSWEIHEEESQLSLDLEGEESGDEEQ